MDALTFPNFLNFPETGTPGYSRTSRAPYKGAGKTGTGNGKTYTWRKFVYWRAAGLTRNDERMNDD